MRVPTRRSLAALSVLVVGLAACGGGDGNGDPAGDVDAAPEGEAAEDPLAEAEVETFEEGDLEEGEVVPGVRLEVPPAAEQQAQPLPAGAGFVAALEDESGAIFLDVQHEGASVDELLADIEALVDEGQAELTETPTEIEVEGADEATTFELTDPTGAAFATGVFATTGTTAVSLAIEVPADSDLDVQAIVDSLVIDPDRLTAEV